MTTACCDEIYGEPEYSYDGEVFCSYTCLVDYKGARDLDNFLAAQERAERNEKMNQALDQAKDYINRKGKEIEDRLEERKRELGRK